MNTSNCKTVVFLGPSLSWDVARNVLDADYQPPATYGDIYQLLGSPISQIVLIDGNFHGVAAIWQREILAAMRAGIHVLGGASMGALRAAELHTHGMVGVGQIFAWYRDGYIDGDDEVALLHLAGDMGYQPLSEPMVNIRYNLAQAVRENYISAVSASDLISYIKSLPFAERTWQGVLDGEGARILNSETRRNLLAFLAHSNINLKQKDALETLETARNPPASLPRNLPETGPYYQSQALSKRFAPCGGNQTLSDLLLTNLAPRRVQLIQRVMAGYFYMSMWIREHGIRVPPQFQTACQRLWRQQVIGPDKQNWLCCNRMTPHEFEDFFAVWQALTWVGKLGPQHFGLPKHRITPQMEKHWEVGYSVSLGTNPNQRLCLDWALPFLCNWAEKRGIQIPAESQDAYCTRLGDQDASLLTVFWMLDKGPAWFGYGTWSWRSQWIQIQQGHGYAATCPAQPTEPLS